MSQCSRHGLRSCFLVFLLHLWLMHATALWAGEDERVEKKEGELKSLRTKIDSLKSDLKGKQVHHKGLLEELRDAEQQIGRQTRKLRVLSGRLKRQHAKINALGMQKQQQQQEIERNRLALAKQLRAAYIMGRQERIKILLNQQNPDTVSRMLVYYDYFNRARTEQIAVLAETVKKLEVTEQDLTAEAQQLANLQQKEKQEKKRLDETQASRKTVIASLGSTIRDKSQQLTGMKKDERRLQDLVKKLQIDLIAVPMDDLNKKPFKSLKGKLRWPAKGRLTARFGTRRAGNLKWDGVMISAPEGREVKAVHHGRVAFADWLRGFGLLLIVDHGDGYMSLYGHNQSLFKEVGEWVQPGESVALIGNSGGLSSTGVYFGIRYKGRPINPKRWCRRVKGNRVGSRVLPQGDTLELTAIQIKKWLVKQALELDS